MAWVMANWGSIVLALTSIVTAASIIAKLTPSTTDDEIVAKLIKIIDFLALNKSRLPMFVAGLLTLALAAPAMAISTIGFSNWSATPVKTVPITCSYVAGPRNTAGILLVETMGSFALPLLTSASSVTLVGSYDYVFTCVRDSTKLAYPAQMFFGTQGSTYYPTDSFTYRQK